MNISYKVDLSILKKFRIDKNKYYILDFETIQEGEKVAEKNNIYYPYHVVSFALVKNNENSYSKNYYDNFTIAKKNKFETQLYLIEKLINLYDDNLPVLVWSNSLEINILKFWIDISSKISKEMSEKLDRLLNNIVDFQDYFDPSNGYFSVENENKKSLDFIINSIDNKRNTYDIKSRECSIKSLELYRVIKKNKYYKSKLKNISKLIRIHNENDVDKIYFLIEWVRDKIV